MEREKGKGAGLTDEVSEKGKKTEGAQTGPPENKQGVLFQRRGGHTGIPLFKPIIRGK